MSTPNDGNEYAGAQKCVRETAEMSTRANASTSENATPKGFEQGLEEGFLDKGVGGSAAASAPRASREDDNPFDSMFGRPVNSTETLRWKRHVVM